MNPQRFSTTAGTSARRRPTSSNDTVSNVVAIRDERSVSDTTGWSPSPVDHEYEYDALYRLTQVDSTYDVSEPTRPHSQSFEYDFLGNMTSWTDDQDVIYDRSLGTIENGVDTNPPSARARSSPRTSTRTTEATYTDAGRRGRARREMPGPGRGRFTAVLILVRLELVQPR